MKRIYLLFLMVMIAWGTQPVLAQDATITIPEEGNFGSSNSLPTTSGYGFSLSQQLYTAAEIGTGGLISSLAFYNTSTNIRTRNLTIYMFETQSASMTSSGLALPSPCTPLFSDNVTFTAEGWNTLAFDTPFEYDGISNLCIVVDDNSGTDSSGLSCQTYGTSTIQAVYIRSDYTNYDPFTNTSYSPSYSKNRIQLTIGDNPYPCPKQMQVTAMTEEDVTISWSNPGGNDVTGWNMQYRVAGAENWETATGTIASPFTLSGLTPHTNYEVRLQALYGTEQSNWAYLPILYEVTYQINVADELRDYITIGEGAVDGTTVNFTLKYVRDYSTETYTGLGIVTITPETGDPITITPTHPTVGYSVVLPTSYNHSFTMPAANVTLTANVTTYYTVSILDVVGEYPRTDSYVTWFNDSKTIRPSQSTITLSPNTNSGNTFVEYQIFSKDMGTGEMTNITHTALNGFTLTTPASYCIVAAHFSVDQDSYTLTVEDDGEYLSGVSTASVHEGAKVSYTVTNLPSTYIITIITEDGKLITPIHDASNQTYYFYMPNEDVTLSAHQIQTYNITYRETDYNNNILLEYTSTANEYEEVEVPFESHDIFDYTESFYVYDKYFNEIFDNYGETSFFTMPAKDVIVEGRFTFNSPAILLSVNGNLIDIIEAEPDEPIQLTDLSDDDIPEGFIFLGWTDDSNWSFSPNFQPYSIYNTTYTLEGDDAITLYAVFYQSGDVDYEFLYNYDYYPIDQDTIIIAGENGDEYDPVFYGLVGAGNNVLLDYWTDGDYIIVCEWIDENEVHHGAKTIAWSVEQISDNPNTFALKQGDQYLNFINGEIALGNDYTHGIFVFEKIDWRYSIMEVNSESYLAFTEDDGYSVETSSDNSLFDLFKQQKPGKNFTTEVHSFGDGDYISYLKGITYITGHVTVHSNWLENRGLLIIKSNGFLDTRECYFMNDYADALIIEDGGQLLCYSEYILGTVLKNITSYAERGNGWHLISSPISGRDGYPTDDITTGTYDFYSYDEETGYWFNSKDEDVTLDVMQQSTGYLYANQEDITLKFTGELMSPIYAAYSIVTRSSSTAGKLAGFNLLGNPYTYNITTSELYVVRPTGEEDDYEYSPIQTIYINDGSKIVVAQNDDATIKPCEGFFVRTGADDQFVVFSDLDEDNRSTVSDIKIEIKLNERGAKLIDRAYINFSAAHNMEKFQLDEHSSRLYIPQDNKDFAVVSVNNEDSMPLNFVASKDGEYTLTINTDNLDAEYIHLVDHLTGTDVDLLTNKSYSFSAKTTDDASRFSILFRAKPITSFTKTSSK